MSKEIVIKATWDEADFKRLMKQLEKVQEAMDKIASTSAANPLVKGGGKGGGGKGGGGGGGGGGVGGDKSSIDALAEAYKAFYSTMSGELGKSTTALKAFFDDSSKKVTDFMVLLDELKGKFASMPSAMPGAGAPPIPGASPVAPGTGPVVPGTGSVAPGTSPVPSGGSPIVPPGGGAPSEASTKTRDGKFTALFRQLGGSIIGSTIGHAAGGGPVGQAIGGALGGLPILGRVLPAVGLAYAAGSLVVNTMQAAYADENSQIAYRKASPFWAQERKAEILGTGGDQVLSMRAGNVGLAIDYARANTPEELKKIDDYVKLNQEEILRRHPQKLQDAINLPGAAGRLAAQEYGHWVNQQSKGQGGGLNLFGWKWGGGGDKGYSTGLGGRIFPDQKLTQADEDVGAKYVLDLKAELHEQVNAGYRQHQLVMQRFGAINKISNDRINTIYSSAQSDFDIARQIGKPGNIGWRWAKDAANPFARHPDAPFGPEPAPSWAGPLGLMGTQLSRKKEYYDDITDHEVAALATGHGSAAVRAQMVRMRDLSGVRGSEGRAGTLLNYEAAGFHNAAQMEALGLQLGNSRLITDLQATASSGRRGLTGVGAVALSRIGSMVEAGVSDPSYVSGGPGAGSGFAQALANIIRTGDPSTDIWRAQRMQQGLGRYQELLGGKTDKLQEVLAWNSSNEAVDKFDRNAPHIRREQLMGMSMVQMYDVLAGGKIPYNVKHALGPDAKAIIGERVDLLQRDSGQRVLYSAIQGDPALESVWKQWRGAEGKFSFKFLKGINPATGKLYTRAEQYETLDQINTMKINTVGGPNAAEAEFDTAMAVQKEGGIFDRAAGKGVSQGVNLKGLRGAALKEQMKHLFQLGVDRGKTAEEMYAWMSLHFTQTQLKEQADHFAALKSEMGGVGVGSLSAAAFKVADVMREFARLAEKGMPTRAAKATGPRSNTPGQTPVTKPGESTPGQKR